MNNMSSCSEELTDFSFQSFWADHCQAEKQDFSLLVRQKHTVTWTTTGNMSVKLTDGNHKMAREPTYTHRPAGRAAVWNACPSKHFSHADENLRGREKWEFTASCGFSGSWVLTAPHRLLLPLVWSSFWKTKRSGLATQLLLKLGSGPSCYSQHTHTHWPPLSVKAHVDVLQ